MVLFPYIFRSIEVTGIALRHLLALALDRLLRREGLPGHEHLKLALQEMGGSFLKFGQILSLQVDLLPRAYSDSLLDLLDRVPAFSADKVREIFLTEFGQAPESLYMDFNYTPFASASIGQVHRAVLKDTTVAAVKVQRPEAEQVFHRDALILNLFIRLVFFFRIRTLYFMRDPVREFNEWIQEELDYRKEAAHATVLEDNARQTPTESVPRIHWSLTRRRVLTMDFLEGYSVLEFLRIRERGDQARLDELKALGFDPAVFVTNIVTNFVSDALRFGVFHADLHPANLLILKNNVAGYVDFGIVGSLSPEARRKVIQLSLAYLGGRSEEIYLSFLEISSLSEGADLAGFRRELERRCLEWYREPAIGGTTRLGSNLNQAMLDLLGLCRSFGLLPKKEMIRYIRSMMLADGLVSRLAPGLDYGPQIRRLCEDYLSAEIRRKFLSARAVLPLFADLSGWMQVGPGALLRTLEMLERGQLPIRADIRQEEPTRSPLKMKTQWAALVWLILLAALGLQWKELSAHPGSLPAVVSLSFLAAWTLWLGHLFRRLRQKKLDRPA